MASRYTPITAQQFRDATSVMMGFQEVHLPGTMEIVFERTIDNGPQPGRFLIRIFSSVSHAMGVTRECGEDAIRVMLIDQRIDKRIDSMVVHRTQNALLNMRKRARELWKFAVQRSNMCPKCGSLLVARQRRNGTGDGFMGCTHFPACRHVEPVRKVA